MSDEINKKIINILNRELIIALGCTEPASIAFISAVAIENFNSDIEKIKIECSTNIIKNVHGVSIPNTNNRKGIKYAIAAGMLIKQSSKKLKILEALKEEDIEKIDNFVENTDIEIIKSQIKNTLFLRIEILGFREKVLVELIDGHTNITKIVKNDEVIFEKEYKTNISANNQYDLNFEEIFEFINKVDIQLIPKCIKDQVELNYQIGKWGLLNNKEINIGQYFKDEKIDIALVASASEARMSGCNLPVVINSGSGNQGLVVSLPLISYARRNKLPKDILYRAIMLSNLLAIWQKQEFSKLSAFCGAVNAAAAVGAALTWLKGGNAYQVKECISNTLASVAGMYCDGAKISCAFKVAICVENATIASSMVLNNKIFHSGEGIIKASVEETISKTATIVNSCSDLDNLILDVILN